MQLSSYNACVGILSRRSCSISSRSVSKPVRAIRQRRSYAELFPFNRVPVYPPIDPKSKPREEWLMRNFVADHLFQKTESYFSQEAPVHYLSQSLDFSRMWGHGDYQNKLHELYQDIDGFMTPVEIFKPYYAQAIGKYMVDVLKTRNQYDTFHSTNPFEITEVGGGNGSCAVGILDFLKSSHPELYQHTRYQIIDVSKPFHEKQKKVLEEHASKVELINEDFFRFKGSSKGHGFFVGLEILDNLPHDKLVIDDQGVVREIWVQTRPESQQVDPFTKEVVEMPLLVENKKPLADPLILAFVKLLCAHYGLDDKFLTLPDPLNDQGLRMVPPPQSHVLPHLVLWHLLRFPSLDRSNPIAMHIKDYLDKKFSPKDFLSLSAWKRELSNLTAVTGGVTTENIYFAPTAAMSLLHTVANRFPNRDLILNDFDKLQGGMHGINAPLVQRTEGNETTTYSSYLLAPAGHVDIFYPTNFDQLAVLQYQLSDKMGQHCTSQQFMKHYADTKATRTRTLYNPLLKDFINTRFLLTARAPFMPELTL